MTELETLQQMVDDSQNIVFFGGAGVSTESQIPDFRSDDGIYQKKEFPYPPERMLSYSFFVEHKEMFFDFYRTMIFPDARPNPAHLKLAEWEKAGKLKAVVTQNIDGLHQLAGSQNVFELHGSVLRNYCRKCGAFYDEKFILAAHGVPKCTKCGGEVKPDVVLYEESLNNEVIRGAVAAIKSCDMLIVGGTSLVVYPAAGLVEYYVGDRLVLLNKSATPYDSRADLVIHDSIGKILSSLH